MSGVCCTMKRNRKSMVRMKGMKPISVEYSPRVMRVPMTMPNKRR